jgi:hypothetical protein
MKPNKYHAETSVYNGYNYDSRLEASYAMQLDWLIKAGEIESVERQYKIDITINGEHICNYFIDFKVNYTDKHCEYHEVKGFETDLWRIKWRLSKAVHPEWKFVLIKK